MIADKSELERMVELIKKEIEASEIAKRIVELDSKLVELRKSVEGIVIELTYIKDELKDLRGDKKKVFDPKKGERVEKIDQKIPQMTLSEKERENKMFEKRTETTEEGKDLIICD
ncbi:MAG: hypothetical protein RMH75_02890 [Archaeoglobaceae archaeon]|nr:hypothetical protein [Archaeoglobaceae archaeon]MDW7989601.1 hypothetical protein [Archaeoglobaceae archaeon]